MKKYLVILNLFILIIVTNIYSQTWELCSDSLSNYIASIAVKNENVFIATDLGVYLSTDNGSTWKSINNGLSTLNITSLAIKEDMIFAGSYGGGLYLSTNNGSSWEPVLNSPKKINSILININDIFITSNTGISKYKDSAGSLIKIFDLDTIKFVGLFNSVAIGDSLILVGCEFGIVFSTDYGRSWIILIESDDKKLDRTIVKSVAIYNGYFLIGGYSFSPMISKDFGKNWINIWNAGGGSVMSIAIERDIIFSGSRGGFTMFSLDSVFNTKWSHTINNGTSDFFIYSFATNKKYIFAGNWHGYVYRLKRDFLNPADTLISGVKQVCTDDSAVYTTKEEEWYTTKWRVEGGDSTQGTDSTIKVYWNKAGTGKITIIKYNNIIQRTDSSSVSVSVYDYPPKPGIKRIIDSLISDSDSGNQWYKNGKAIPGATGSVYCLTDTGHYTVQVTLNGCASPMSETIYVDYISVEENEPFFSFALYPNFDNSELAINYRLSKPGNVRLFVFNQLGTEITKIEEGYKDAGFHRYQFSIVNCQLNNGIYYVVLNAGGNISAEKVVVIR